MRSLVKAIRKVKKRPFCSAVVVAAGVSHRAGTDKLFAELDGIPVLARALAALEDCPDVDEIVVVTRQEKIVEVAGLCRTYGISKATKVVCGGETRTHSALAGVSETDPRAEVIAIHDGARPLVTPELVSQVIHAAVLYNAAVPGTPVKDTIKRGESRVVTETLERAQLTAVQTPQAFQADLIKAALTGVVQRELAVTDDSAAAEAMGIPVRLVPGDEENIKLTTPLDFQVAAAILKMRREI